MLAIDILHHLLSLEVKDCETFNREKKSNYSIDGSFCSLLMGSVTFYRINFSPLELRNHLSTPFFFYHSSRSDNANRNRWFRQGPNYFFTMPVIQLTTGYVRTSRRLKLSIEYHCLARDAASQHVLNICDMFQWMSHSMYVCMFFFSFLYHR